MNKKIKKIKIAIIYGGKSVEHEVSLMSAKNVARALDKSKYQIVFIKISNTGKWSGYKSIDDFKKNKINVVFPILHGPYGEDGTIQGLLKLAGVPFVGPSILGSSIGFDKDVIDKISNFLNLRLIKI
jgi:D-alanine-D-alanine ligase